MENIHNWVPYNKVPDSQAIHIITNLKENLKENISYSTDPSLQSLKQYIQFVAKEDLPLGLQDDKQPSKCPVQKAKSILRNILWWDRNTEPALCPFVPGMNKKNLHYALLYNEIPTNFDNFYQTCIQELAKVQKHNKSKLTTLYGIFNDATLDTQEFSDTLQMYCMKRKSEIVASWHMAWAMLSRHRPWGAERIFNKDTFSTKANNFKTEWFSYIAFRKLHFDDFGSMRTPENMESFMPHFPGVGYQIKYIPQFIQFLQDKIQQDKDDMHMIEHMDPDSIIIHYYEHHLMDKSEDEIVALKSLFISDFSKAKANLTNIIHNTEQRYQTFIEKLKYIQKQLPATIKYLST